MTTEPVRSMEAASAPPPRRRQIAPERLHTLVEAGQRSGLIAAFVLLVVFFSASAPRFLTGPNIEAILLQVSIVGIAAVPGAMLVLAGYVDLSVGSVAVLASVVFGKLMTGGMPVGLAMTLALLVGAGWGLLNGILICRFGFSAIVVTLAGLAGARGLAEAISQGQTTTTFGDTFAKLGNGTFLGIDIPVVILIVVFAVGAWVWYAMPSGRHMVAIGADRTAAHSVGISTRRIPTALYVCSGAAAALAGLILTSQLDGATLDIGNGFELDVLTAVLLGGVSFTGGRGSLVGVAIGVLFVGALENGLVLLNIGPFYSNLAVGAALLVAAGLDVLHTRLERLPVMTEPPQPPAPAASGGAT
jgi:ribose transport system permease protein